ncbi:DUF4747 family protein [Pseudomonas sp. HK3]
MPNKRSLTISALNITMHPHSAAKYISLIKKAEQSKTAIRVAGDTYLQLVKGIYNIDAKNIENGIYGEIAKYTDISKDATWLNLQTESAAEEKDMKAVSIPPNMKPNYGGFTFVFYPKVHQFYFEQKNGSFQLSPNYVHTLLKGLFALEHIQEEFNKVDVTVMPYKDKVTEILNIFELKNLKLNITRPNPDDFGDDEDIEVFKLLDAQNIETQIIENRAVKGKSITPSENMKKLARIAANNGFVEGSGKDQQGIPVSDSTKSHPFKLVSIYDPAKTGLLETMHAAAMKAMAIFK